MEKAEKKNGNGGRIRGYKCNIDRNERENEKRMKQMQKLKKDKRSEEAGKIKMEKPKAIW